MRTHTCEFILIPLISQDCVLKKKLFVIRNILVWLPWTFFVSPFCSCPTSHWLQTFTIIGPICLEKAKIVLRERRAPSPQLPKIVLDLISLTENRGCFLICKYSWCLKITQALLSYDISFHGDVMTITTYLLRFPWLMRFSSVWCGTNLNALPKTRLQKRC